MRQLIVCIFWIFANTLTYAQQITLSGKVEDANTGKGLQGVVVTIRPKDGNRVLRFCKTKDDGSYQLLLTSMPEGKNVLHFSMMGYATKVISLSKDTTQYDVLLNEQTTKLKDVVVKAPSIRQRGDTITYSVSSYADVNDKSLADVLKKMPGMDVSDNGEIKYNGKTINKFYIEGHDMLGGRYSIATNNIHQKDVGSVEVMTNHQPIKALADMSFSQDPAINIKLKESAKSRLVGTLKVGGGFEQKEDESLDSPNVWKGDMALMRFTKKAQSLNTFKSNNIGTDVTREGNLLFADSGEGVLGNNYSLKDYVNVAPDRLTDISDSRVRKNQTHAFTTNNLWALGKNTDLSSQIVYTHDRILSSSYSNIQYFLNDSIIYDVEDEQSKQKQNKLVADFTLTSNGEKTYVVNQLSCDLAWNDITINVTGTYPNQQLGKMPKYKVSDKLELLKRSGKRAYAFSTYNAYMVNPHSLLVNVQKEGANVGNASSVACQNIRSAAFFSHTNTSLGFYLKPFTVTMKVGLQVLSRTMKSLLDGAPDSLGNMHNQIGMSYYRVYASPEVEFNHDGWHVRFLMPIAYTPYFYKDYLVGSNLYAYKAQVSPQLSVSYYLTSRLQATLSGGISQRDVDEQNFYQGMVMRDYRNLYIGFVDYMADKRKNVSLNINYKRPLATIFANAYINKSWSDSHLTTTRDFMGDYIVNSYLTDKSKSENLMAGGRVSKGLGFMHGLVSVSLDYLKFDGTLRQNGSPSVYSSDCYMLTTKWSGRPTDWCNFIYELSWNLDEMTLKTLGFQSSSTSLSQHITCNFHPLKSWFVKLQGDYYRNQVADNQHKSLFLADVSTSYSFKNGMELNLATLNLFNQQIYGYTVYSGFTRLSKEYQLRNRTILMSIFFHF